ncbi:acyltransferase family protein [Streptomyces mauvecolor]
MDPHPEPKTPARPIRQLNSIAAARLVPSFCILASHLSFENVFKDGTTQGAYYRIFNPLGFNSVSFFIVLSGFILTWISIDRAPGPGFKTKRLLRILPVHFITWAVIVCAFGALLPKKSLAATLTLLQGWIPDHSVYFSVNAPAWTLSTEIVLYLAFPWIHRFLTGRTTDFLLTALVGLIAVLVLLPAVLQSLPDGATFSNAAFSERGQLVDVSEWKYWLVYISPFTRFLEALCGVLTCLLVVRGKWPKSVLLPSLLLVAAVVAEELWAPFLMTLSAFTIVPVVLLIGSLAAREIGSRTTTGKIVGKVSALGKYTFGIYMYQWVLILLCEQYLRPWGNSLLSGILLIAVFYAVCLAISFLSNRWIETPVNSFMRPNIAARAAARPGGPRTASPAPERATAGS